MPHRRIAVDLDLFRRAAVAERSRVRSEMLAAGGRLVFKAIGAMIRRMIALGSRDRHIRRIRTKPLAPA